MQSFTRIIHNLQIAPVPFKAVIFYYKIDFQTTGQSTKDRENPFDGTPAEPMITIWPEQITISHASVRIGGKQNKKQDILTPIGCKSNVIS